MAAVVTVAGAFLLTLIVVSIITVKISDKILDSRIGALDRTLGFLFGLARGLLIVVVAFVFFDWLVPAKSQPTWITNANSLIVLQQGRRRHHVHVAGHRRLVFEVQEAAQRHRARRPDGVAGG